MRGTPCEEKAAGLEKAHDCGQDTETHRTGYDRIKSPGQIVALFYQHLGAALQEDHVAQIEIAHEGGEERNPFPPGFDQRQRNLGAHDTKWHARDPGPCADIRHGERPLRKFGQK